MRERERGRRYNNKKERDKAIISLQNNIKIVTNKKKLINKY